MMRSRVSKKMRKEVPDRVQEGAEEDREVGGEEEEDEVEEAEEVEEADAEEVEEVEEVEEAEEAEEVEEVEEGEEEVEGGIWHLKDTLQKMAFRQQLSSTWN